VDLNPAGAEYSDAYGVGGGQQVGRARVAGVIRASLWTGSAASWVNLRPSGAFESTAFGAGDGQQVGVAVVFTGSATQNHASLWSGSAASWVDLHPTGAISSFAYDASGGWQAGQAHIGGVWHAGAWSGSASSFADLHAVLTNFFDSYARGVWRDGNTLYVVGYGYNLATNRNEALMWVREVPPPCADASGDGVVNFADITSVLSNWGSTGPAGDANQDGVVNFADITAVFSQWSAVCS